MVCGDGLGGKVSSQKKPETSRYLWEGSGWEGRGTVLVAKVDSQKKCRFSLSVIVSYSGVGF